MSEARPEVKRETQLGGRETLAKERRTNVEMRETLTLSGVRAKIGSQTAQTAHKKERKKERMEERKIKKPEGSPTVPEVTGSDRDAAGSDPLTSASLTCSQSLSVGGSPSYSVIRKQRPPILYSVWPCKQRGEAHW